MIQSDQKTRTRTRTSHTHPKSKRNPPQQKSSKIPTFTQEKAKKNMHAPDRQRLLQVVHGIQRPLERTLHLPIIAPLILPPPRRITVPPDRRAARRPRIQNLNPPPPPPHAGSAAAPGRLDDRLWVPGQPRRASATDAPQTCRHCQEEHEETIGVWRRKRL